MIARPYYSGHVSIYSSNICSELLLYHLRVTQKALHLPYYPQRYLFAILSTAFLHVLTNSFLLEFRYLLLQ